MTTRRGFFASMIAAAAAPAVVRASSLMPITPSRIWTPQQGIVKPPLGRVMVSDGWEIHPIGDIESIFATQLYTGKGQTQTIEHSIGWKPEFIMIKRTRT